MLCCAMVASWYLRRYGDLLLGVCVSSLFGCLLHKRICFSLQSHHTNVIVDHIVQLLYIQFTFFLFWSYWFWEVANFKIKSFRVYIYLISIYYWNWKSFHTRQRKAHVLSDERREGIWAHSWGSLFVCILIRNFSLLQLNLVINPTSTAEVHQGTLERCVRLLFPSDIILFIIYVFKSLLECHNILLVMQEKVPMYLIHKLVYT